MTTSSTTNDLLPASAQRAPYENFPVLSLALPRRLRPAFAAVYSFCRLSDDIADDPSRDPGKRLEALRLWRDELNLCFEGKPRLPMFRKLEPVIRNHALPIDPFHRLLDAFELDQTQSRFEDWSQLEAYAALSADPVGELVLRIAGHGPHDPNWATLLGHSNRTCSALQFINFWQDVRRDLFELDRIYIPRSERDLDDDDLRRLASGEGSESDRQHFARILRPLVERTDAMMRSALPLPSLVSPAIARPITLFQRAGLALSGKIRRQGCSTLWRRPSVSRASLVLMSCRVMLGRAGASA